MVIAGVALDESTLGFLKEIGVKDSKKLSRKKREELFDVILETSSGFSVVKVEPEQIDRENLNSLTYRAVNKIISSLIYLNPTKVTVDKVGQESEVINYLNSLGITSNVVHEADVNFVECSAASVVAKVIRDRAIDEIKRTYGDIGSGYPSDERTVTWVSEIHRSNELLPLS